MYCPARPAGGAMGMKCRNPFSPKTRNSRPSRIRAINVAIFIIFSPYVRFTPFDLRRYLPDPLKGWLQESLTVHRARHNLCRAARCHKRHIGHADKAQTRLQIGINEVQCTRRGSGLIDSATGNDDRVLVASEQSLRSAFAIPEFPPPPTNLVTPHLNHAR